MKKTTAKTTRSKPTKINGALPPQSETNAAKTLPSGAQAAPRMSLITTCTKMFPQFPFAHRQHSHDGHCAWIHGHNFDFEVTFAAALLDENRFVVDFGKLGFIKEWLTEHFDHTLVLNESDPWVGYLQEVLTRGDKMADEPQAPCTFAKIVVVPNCGAEALAAYVLHHLNGLLTAKLVGQDRGLYVQQVTVYEDSKNSATATLLVS